jgi:exodeoxyribonuclease X
VKIADLPDDYRRWALNNLTDMDFYLRKALEA